MSVIYLCADGEAAPDEMQSQIIVCFIFYAICLFLKLCHNAQTRRRGDSPPDAPPIEQKLILRVRPFSGFYSTGFAGARRGNGGGEQPQSSGFSLPGLVGGG